MGRAWLRNWLAVRVRARRFYKGVASLGFLECGLKIKF